MQPGIAPVAGEAKMPEAPDVRVQVRANGMDLLELIDKAEELRVLKLVLKDMTKTQKGLLDTVAWLEDDAVKQRETWEELKKRVRAATNELQETEFAVESVSHELVAARKEKDALSQLVSKLQVMEEVRICGFAMFG